MIDTEDLYYLVWKKSAEDDGFRGFYIPDTVIFKDTQAVHWFFTAFDRKIKRKTNEKLNIADIERSFLRKPSASRIVASYTYKSGPKQMIEYLEKEEFRHLLHYRKKEGVLQRFVEPKGQYEQQIQTVWTPNLCMFEARENKKKLNDTRFDLYERAITFEGEEFHSKLQPVFGQILRNRLKKFTEDLIKHINDVSKANSSVKRAVVYYKLDKNDNVWLIRASELKGNQSFPISLNMKTFLPETVNRKRLSVFPSTSFQKTVICKNCGEAVESDKFCEISYKMVINAQEDELIPLLLKKIYTNLSQDEYEKFKNNSLFLDKKTLVCDTCFLEYSKDFHRLLPFDALGTQPLNPTKLAKRRENTVQTKTRTRPSTAGANDKMKRNSSFSEFNLPKRSLARSIKEQKSLTKMLGSFDVSYFFEDQSSKRRLK